MANDESPPTGQPDHGRDAPRPLGLDPWLLEILACPACRASVRVDEPASTLVCTGCGLVYPVRDGIPVMLVDEAIRPGS
jgi:uncharacterized protein YbaR (Trm112 family)